jgi:virulence factor Mce-like protein
VSAVTAVVDRAARVQRSPLALAGLGVALSALVVGTIAVVFVTFGGGFTKYVPVEARISGSGNAVSKGDQVVYRDIPVGTVASASTVAGKGQAVVAVHIIPYRARSIPANVTASVAPVTVFGTEDLILNAPAHPSAARLSANMVVPAKAGVGDQNLQGTVSNLDEILRALHPAQLDTALTAMATALDGQGSGLGRTLSSLDVYLKAQLPHFPLLERDLGLLAPLANQVAASAPQLVGSLSNLTTTADTVTSHAAQLRQAFADGAAVSNQLYDVLAPTQRPFEEILSAAGPFFRDVTQSPTELARILSGLRAWASSWSAAERSGPYLSFSTSVPLANATDLVFAALNAPGSAGPGGYAAGALGTSHVDPAPYTSRSTPFAASAVRIGPALVSPAEAQRAAVLVSDLRGGLPVTSPAVASLLLDPLLNNLVVGS